MRKLILPLAVVLLSACNHNQGNVELVVDTVAVKQEPAVPDTIPEKIFSYKGILPCADCSGVLTELVLNKDSMFYTMQETYLGTNDGDRAFQSTGKFTAIPAVENSNDVIIYKLVPDKNGSPRFFKALGDAGLRLLDKDQKEISGSRNYVLVRK